MTRAKISEYSATANDNTDVNGINIAEGCPPSSMNNMGREIMAALKRFQVGSDGDGVTVGGSLVVSGSTTANTLSATVFQIDTISEKTSAAGVTVDGVLLKDSQVSTDQINEKTSATGVTIDGVLLKDSGVVTGAGTVSAPVYSTTGDLNTGIFFPAADTIAFAEGGAEAMRIDSSGNVGIGTSSPTEKLHIVDTSNPAPADGGSVIIEGRRDGTANLLQLRARDNDTPNSPLPANQGGIIRFAGFNGSSFEDMAAIQYTAAADLASGDTPGNLIFSTTPSGSSSVTERMRITSDGYLRMASGTGGIQFNGDTAAANALDDYEEGTFAVTLAPNTSGTITINTGVDLLAYTKIGRVVFVQGLLEALSVSSPTGTYVEISGLPFSTADLTEYAGRSGGSIYVTGATPGAYGVQILEGVTAARIAVPANNVQAGTQFYVQFNYIAA